MKRLCISILFSLLCMWSISQNPFALQDSAKFITEAGKEGEKFYLTFLYQAYDSAYKIHLTNKNYKAAGDALKLAFELANRNKDSFYINDRLVLVAEFYKSALAKNWPISYPSGPGKTREMVLQITSAKQINKDSVLIVFAGGKAEGLTPGVTAECIASDQPQINPHRSSNLLGKGFITVVTENSSTAVIEHQDTDDSSDMVYPGDLLMLNAQPLYENEIGDYQFLADLDISFQDNYRQQPYSARQLIAYPIKNQQQLLDTFYLNAVKEIADMLKDDTSEQFKIKISNGLFKGRYMIEALTRTKIQHLHTFLQYVKRYPGKYSGKKYKFSEVYATWVINNSPLHEETLLQLLVQYTGTPYFNELVNSYDSAIIDGNNWLYWKSSFIDSLDRGEFKKDEWQVLQAVANIYKKPILLSWLKVLEGRVLALQSKKQEALTKLEEAENYFLDFKMNDDAAFVKNQIFEVSNQRVAKIAVQTSHFLPYSFAFSPNGKYLTTFGDDYTIKVWDAKLMRQITTIAAHTSTINQVTFTSNSRYFISASDDETIKVWDAGSLLLYKTIHAGYRVKYATINKLGNKIIAAGSDSLITVFDLQTGKADSSYRIHKAKINTGDYNPDYPQLFISGASDSLACITNIQTGNMLWWYKSGGRVSKVKITADNRYMTVQGDNGEIKVWRVRGKYMGSFPSFKTKYGHEATSQEVISGYDILSSKKLIAFVDKERRLCIGSLDSMRYNLFDLKLENDILEVAFHPSGNTLVLTTMMGKMYVVNIRQFEFGKNDQIQWVAVGNRSRMVSSMRFSSDSKLFAFQSGSTYVLNLSTGKTVNFGEEAFSQLRGNINFTKNDSALLFVPLDGQRVHEQNLVSGDTLYSFSTKPYYIAYQDLSPDKKFLITGFYKKAYVIYDVDSRKVVHTIPLDSATHNQLSGALILQEKKVIVLNDDIDNSVSFYKMNSQVLKPFARYTSKQEQPFYCVVYNKEKDEIIGACQDNNLYFFNAETGGLKDTINFDYIDKREGISVIRLMPDGRTLFLGMNSHKFIFDLQTKKIINTFDDENYVLTTAEVSPDGSLMAIGTFTGTINFYDTKTLKKLLQVETFVDKDPVWITPDNYYLSGKTSLKELYFKYNNTLYPFDQFDINFNRPDKVLEKLGKADPALLKAYNEAWRKRFKKSGISESRLRPDFKVPEVRIINQDNIPSVTTTSNVIRIKMAFTDIDTTIESYNIWVNGIPEYGTHGKYLLKKGKEVIVTDSVRLTGAVNVIQVACKNSNGVESLKEKFEVRNFVTDTTARKTYLFVASVSNYKEKKYNLRYASKDGRDLVTTFREKFRENLVVDTLFDENANLKNILAWKQKMLRTRMTDRVILYISGHGVLDKNFDFYYATQNIDFNNPAGKGLAYDDIEKLLDSIPARQKLLLMDACHSGEVDKDDVVINDVVTSANSQVQVVYKSKGVGEEKGIRPRLGLGNSFELMQDLFANLNSGNGTVVISAAAGNSYAFESDEWHNGVFTYSILHALKDQAADLDHNQRISVSELQQYVSTQVQKLTKGAQKPTARQENLENNWIIW